MRLFIKTLTKNINSYLNANIWLAMWVLFLVVLAAPFTHAQNSDSTTSLRPTNSFNMGLIGDGSYMSFNYEKLFLSRPNYFFTVEAGVGYSRIGELYLPYIFILPRPVALLTIPCHFTFNIGKGRHYVEAGLGVTANVGDTPHKFIVYPQLGYRLMPTESNVNFKVYSQWIDYRDFKREEKYFLPIGVSFGYSF